MREIEVKFRVRDSKALVDRLAILGCNLDEPITQDDLIFTGSNLPDGSRCVLRIRTTKVGSILTLKKDITNELDCLEVETMVDDPEATQKLLTELGYQPVVRVKKARRQGVLNDWTVCLDEVADLGSFVEFEVMTESESYDQESFATAVRQLLDIPNLERITQGYDTLMLNSGRVYIKDEQ